MVHGVEPSATGPDIKIIIQLRGSVVHLQGVDELLVVSRRQLAAVRELPVSARR